MKGIKNGIVWAVKDALEEGADVHSDTDAPLRVAAEFDNTEIVKILLDAGANIHSCNEHPLKGACIMGRLDNIKLLLDRGANANVVLPNLDFYTGEFSDEVNNLLKQYTTKGKIKKFFNFSR